MKNKTLPSKPLKRILLLLFIILVLIGTARVAIIKLQALQAVPERVHVGFPVKTAEVQAAPIKNTVIYCGTVRPDREVSVASKLMGKIESINCSEGEVVRRGQVLVALDNSELAKKVNALEARVDSAQINASYWEKEANTYKTLVDQGAVAQHDYQNILLKKDSADAVLKEARAALEEARASLANTGLSSPISGVVTSVAMEEGEMASPGKPILTVADTGLLKAVIQVIEGDLSKIKDGTAAIITSPGTVNTIESRVERIYPALNPSTRTATIEVLIPEPKETGLLPGMSVDVSIVLAQKEKAIAVPASAVKIEGEASYLFVVKDGRAVKKKVSTGIKGSGKIEITQGISEKETVIVSPPAELHDGQKIYVPGEESI